MAEKIAFENDRISNFEGLATLALTFTLNRIILHTIVRHSSTSTYTPYVTEIDGTFADVLTDGQRYSRTDI